MKLDRVALLAVVVLVALAGCSGGDGGPVDVTATDAAGGGGSGDGGGGGGGAASDWCAAGQTVQMSNPQTGEQASWEVQGVVEEDGRQLCQVSWQTNQGDVQRVEMYFTQDQSYRKMVTYDGNGNVVNEVELTGDGSGAMSGGDGSTDGSDGATGGDGSMAGGTSNWCGESASMQFRDPETGELVSMEVEGMVEHEGRQVCKAVWETNQGNIRTMEMYFNEDRSYQKMVFYDANGNVIREMQMGQS